MSKSLQSMNNDLKVFVNEATGISNNCRLKLIKLVDKHFFVHLPKENYLHVDIVLQENGNVMMRDVLYESENPVSSLEELEERFQNFKSETEILLAVKGTNFQNKKTRNEILNLLVLLLMVIAGLFLLGYGISILLAGDLRGFIWLFIVFGSYIFPSTTHSFKSRFLQAYRYIKSIFKK